MSWKERVEKYCADFNIPIDYLPEVLSDPKVVPMIRGKSFEFSALVTLQRVLPAKTWDVRKVAMNAQLGSHDEDLTVKHLPSGKVVKVECKLAKKEGYKLLNNGDSEIAVKCMRSRTLGEERARQIAPTLGVTYAQLAAHADNYRASDFDFVLTTLGNAFFRTDEEGDYVWAPTPSESQFFARFKEGNQVSQSDVFGLMFMARSADLVVGPGGPKCRRKKCRSKNKCGFIPNYPLIHFEALSDTPDLPWRSVSEAARVFTDFVK